LKVNVIGLPLVEGTSQGRGTDKQNKALRWNKRAPFGNTPILALPQAYMYEFHIKIKRALAARAEALRSTLGEEAQGILEPWALCPKKRMPKVA
jgi:hypothetical protein